ncbi:MAG: tRNA (pseudouridine(54)-N(1))-methyltransferase TrmY [Thermoplasmata archaeon HGW-Thermoplasmata-1]|nr:MAG: tRNA (pseudouridine(54)-N(1))-methyltransferase TrmY [Thermoplasmata archaeon HGW-Thermoplasmata-1]
MRRFLVIGHKAKTDGDFTLNDLCGGAGRIDVLARCVNSAFFLSHDLRRDTELYLVLLGEPDAPKTLRMAGSELKYLNPDERSTGALIKKALSLAIPDDGYEVESTPGIYVSRREFAQTLDSIAGVTPYFLDEGGEDVRSADIASEPVFVLSDHFDPTDEELAALETAGAKKLGLGPMVLHGNHCITLVHNELDRRA